MPPYDSSTGGQLKPGPGIYGFDFILGTDPQYQIDSVPPEGQKLEDFLQQLLVGITGLPPQLVRPYPQDEPSPLPPFGTDWIAISIQTMTLDPGFPWQLPEAPPAPPNWVSPPTQGTYLIHHEMFDLACTSYGPHAQWYDGLVRDGFSVGQNRDLLRLTAMGLNRVGGATSLYEYIQQRQWRRVDRTIRIHREIRRLYPILNILSSVGEIVVNGRHRADFGPGFIDDTVE